MSQYLLYLLYVGFRWLTQKEIDGLDVTCEDSEDTDMLGS